MKPSKPLSPYRSILILSDIEGSSGCGSYQASQFLTKEWQHACVEMSRDINRLVKALFNAGVYQIVVKDFHRTGYNLLPELIDSRATIRFGYQANPVMGIGDPAGAEAVMMIGMHAASGSTGFLAHTLTSRIRSLTVNGRLMPEVELFAASLAPFDISPIFFSGCPVACDQAKSAINGIHTYSIDKTADSETFSANSWRNGLETAAVSALNHSKTTPYKPKGPFHALIDWREGRNAARRLSRRWGFRCKGSQIYIETEHISELYLSLVRLCYLTPLTEKLLPLSLKIYHLIGKFGLYWLRKHQKISQE